MDSNLISASIGFIVCGFFVLIGYLVVKDFLMQKCNNELLELDKKRSVVCVVKFQAAIVDTSLIN